MIIKTKFIEEHYSMKISILTYLVLYSFFIISCTDNNSNINSDEEKSSSFSNHNSRCPKYILKNKVENLNISILLDLSDRIEEHKIVEKDTAYLSSISKAFINHIKNKKLIFLEDKVQLFFNPEPLKGEITEIAQQLKIRFTKDTPQPRIKNTVVLYKKYPIKLYQLAIEDAEENLQYPGSDIWRFFKDNVKDYCIDECHRNVLIILTDGYMYHEATIMNQKNRTSYITPNSLKRLNLNKNNWKEKIEELDLGFIPATNNLDDLEILVIGINSQNPENPYAQDIINTYWSKWFEEMGLENNNYKIKAADIPTNIEEVIFDFILNK